MTDVLFIFLTGAFFAVAWGLVLGCERLLGNDDELIAPESVGVAGGEGSSS